MRESFALADPGPLLAGLLEAQRRDEAAVQYPMIEQIAEALVGCARDRGAIIWPVGSAAERIAGAAILLAEGELRVADWNRRLDGERVLVFAVSGTTPLSLAAAAAQVRSMGAVEVHACGIDVHGAADVDAWTSYATLAADRVAALIH